jgi:dihydrofolate synthase/folylpolyglutamate synthase
VLSQVVITRSSSPRALDPDDLGAVAVSIFGADRVLVVPRLVDALADAIALAEADDAGFGGGPQSGVLVTGSVVTAGEARTLLNRER